MVFVALDDSGAFYMDVASGAGLQFVSLDVPVVSPVTSKGEPTTFAMPLKPITDPITAMAFNFYSNVWNTNYIFWYPYHDQDKNFKARFAIEVIEKGGSLAKAVKERLNIAR